MAEHNDIDQVTGTSTTGHQWDGIKELNTPLPRWWVITFYLTIVWSFGYWIVIRHGPWWRATRRACSDIRAAPTSRSNSPIWRRSAATRW